jgi:hypothetical protein
MAGITNPLPAVGMVTRTNATPDATDVNRKRSNTLALLIKRNNSIN